MKRLLVIAAIALSGLAASFGGGASAHHTIGHNGDCYQGIGGLYCTVDGHEYRCYQGIGGIYCKIDGVYVRI